MPDAPSRRTVPPGLGIPPRRRTAATRLVRALEPGMRVALMTHVNADGDGSGSEVAMWHFLTRAGLTAHITNPTPFPPRFGFLLEGLERSEKSRQAVRYLERADAILVLDIADLGRLGHLARIVERTKVPVLCVDHHASDGNLPPGPRMVDPSACATGELVYDLSHVAGWGLDELTGRALYVALLADTGGFRFANTTARTMRIAADLLDRGVKAEVVYADVYAAESEGKIRLLGEVLDTLAVEPENHLAWMTIPPGAMERHGVEADELEGVVEFARSIRGVQLALLFRQLANGRIKVSFRSMGPVDVAKLAERFGGGGHRKAAGASLEGGLEQVQALVIEAARSVARP